VGEHSELLGNELGRLPAGHTNSTLLTSVAAGSLAAKPDENGGDVEATASSLLASVPADEEGEAAEGEAAEGEAVEGGATEGEAAGGAVEARAGKPDRATGGPPSTRLLHPSRANTIKDEAMASLHRVSIS